MTDVIEEWRVIEGFERYYVSSLGRIKSTIGKEKILKPTLLKSGYYQIKLRKNKKSYNRFVHRLVAIAFLENSDYTKEVHHKNTNRKDNRVCNLEWLTIEEHRKKHKIIDKERAARGRESVIRSK